MKGLWVAGVIVLSIFILGIAATAFDFQFATEQPVSIPSVQLPNIFGALSEIFSFGQSALGSLGSLDSIVPDFGVKSKLKFDFKKFKFVRTTKHSDGSYSRTTRNLFGKTTKKEFKSTYFNPTTGTYTSTGWVSKKTETAVNQQNSYTACSTDASCGSSSQQVGRCVTSSGVSYCRYTSTTFWGRVTNAVTGAALAGKQLSFYLDTGIASNYGDPSQLETYMYDKWQTLAPKATPDFVTDINGYFYTDLADGTWNYVISGSREDEMEAKISSSDGAKKRDSEVNENVPSGNFNAEGHILYAGKYEKQDENDETNGNKYTCGQSVRFVMFGVNNGGTDETITFAVQDHTSIGGPIAPMIFTGNASVPAESLTVPAGNKAKNNFDWTIPCPRAAGRYDIHVFWDNEVWHKIGNFFVVEDTTLPEINLGGITSVTTFTNQPVTIGYYAGDVLQTGTMPDVIMQIAGQVVGGVPDTSITVKVNKDVVNNPTGVDITAFGGESEVNLTYNQSGYYAANFTATDQSGNTAYRQVNISVFITEDEADAIALPFYTTYCLLNVSGELRYDRQEYIGKSNPDVDASFDMYSPPDLGGVDVGHEYVTPNDGLNETEYTALKAAESTCGVEYVKVINMTTTTGFCNELYDWFNWLDTSCTNICTLPPAKATVCGT